MMKGYSLKKMCVFFVCFIVVGFGFLYGYSIHSVNLCILVNAHFRSVDSDRCLWMLG